MKVPSQKKLNWFWKKVRKAGENECWVWTACINNDGYGSGQDPDTKKTVRSHRASYEIHFGEIPPGKLVLHKCDNPPCVNPSHLFLGTQRENVYDCIRKNRRALLFGEAHGRAKLKERTVKLIRELHNDYGIPITPLSEWFGVRKQSVKKILENKNWSRYAEAD